MNRTFTAIMKPCVNKLSSSTPRQSGVPRRFSAVGPVLFSLILLGVLPAKAMGYSIWNDSFMPANVSVPDGQPLTLGAKFQSEVDGYITGIRFYKSPENTGNNVGSLWTKDGVKLASTTFSNETAGGWQEQMFASPVAISSNTTYVATYHAPSGYYAATPLYFSTGSYANPPLTALGDGVDGGNGVYVYAASDTFPTLSFNSANYWVDVVFVAEIDPCANDTNAPVITECATDRTLAADGNGQVEVPDLRGEVVAVDDCPGMLVVTQSPTAGTLLGLGQHPVTLTVTDVSGNSTNCTATLTFENQSHSPGVIGDFVWNDLNRNGIQDSGEPGLPGVRVRLFDCSTHCVIATQFTDSAGYYRFGGCWTNGLYLKFDRLSNYAFSPRNQGTDDTRDSDVDRFSGKTECFFLNCQMPASPGCVQTNWDAGMFWAPCNLPGVGSPGYWKNHLDLWPATLTLGGRTYTAAQAHELMRRAEGSKDRSLTLFRSLVAAKLNVLCGNESWCIAETLTASDQWMSSYPPGSGVAASSAAWKAGEPLHLRLDAYNNGRLCAPRREGRLSVWCGGGNDRPSHLRLRIDGEPGAVYCIQESTNFVHWTTIATVTNWFGITEYLTQMLVTKPHTFYRVVRAPGDPSVELFQNVLGTFMELANDRRVTLFPLVYCGDLIIRGNHNKIKGSFTGQTVIAGNVVIYGNANCVSDLKVLGRVILRGNANVLRNVDACGGVENTGNENLVFPGGPEP